jgi:subtilisin-like proprotein convertase family protein
MTPFLPQTLLLLLFLSTGLNAATTIVDYTVNSSVPDNNPTGLVDTRTIIGSSITSITSIEVRFQSSGGWNGDLYAFLSHDSGFSVLLNRPGTSSLDTIGSASSGFNVVFSDDAITDIHTGLAGGGYITGTWQPDARNVDPDFVLDTDPRTAFLSSFNGLAADGNWTLFMADMSAGDESTLTGWGLTITGSVPEPSRVLLLMLGLASSLLRRRRCSASP